VQSFNYRKATSASDALNGAVQARFLSGGTTLIDLMKLDVETPHSIIDVNALPFGKIEKTKSGGLHVGASVKNSDLANNEIIKKEYSVLSEALLSGASPQLRNKASTAGNLLQRTRCVYFRDTSKPCNKREPKSGCAAIEGFNRNLAILGTSSSCIANNPSDMNVAMMALEAKIHLQMSVGSREVAIQDFYLLPGNTPEKETIIQPGELITGVTLDPLPKGSRSLYLKLRDRASYEFALASVAVIASVKAGKFEHIRLAMGGVGTRPWRSLEAERVLEGASVSEGNFKKAAEEALKEAKPQSLNGFKIELAKRCLVQALKQVTGV
jgi:xanthine dehydrogenase YagS FAD-binding subunit